VAGAGRDRAARGRIRLPQGTVPAEPAARGRRGLRLLIAADPVLHGHRDRRHRHRAVPANASHASLAAWTSPTALLAGFLFVAACGYLAAVYLVGEAQNRGDRHLQTYFTRRAQAAAIVAGALSLAILAELSTSSPALYARLTGRALPPAVLAGACGLAVLALLAAGRPKGIRVIAALGVAAVVWGWGVARYPVLLPGTTVTLTNAGAPQATMVAITVVFIVAVLLVGPSFALLFTLQSRRLLGAGEHGALTAAAPAGHSGHAAAAHPRQPSPNGHPGPAARSATLGIIAIAAIIRRRRCH
jgi:cytochrome d ubiquinol oxidase subunit II